LARVGSDFVLLLATRNRKKLGELDRILSRARLPARLLGLDDVQGAGTASETGATFSENAREKALFYAATTRHLCLADDSGLEVDALGGAPGVRSARYAGGHASDVENRARLLRELEPVPDTRRGARFRCSLALAVNDHVLFEADGVSEGCILREERGRDGFGYDPLFFSTELGLTFAECDSAAKDRVSHRGRALAKLVEFLRSTPRPSSKDPPKPW
jgi:XTP/dITP diphosphohydrolase